MYIIIEGMPGTGKTAIAKRLSEKANAVYVKSVFSNAPYGEKMRQVSESGKAKDAEFLYLIDLLLDELRIIKLLANNHGVVRDKTYASSIAHLRAHGYVNKHEDIIMAMNIGYNMLSEYSVAPDCVVYIRPNRDRICEHLHNKSDLSSWDDKLTNDSRKYSAQCAELEQELFAKYRSRLIEIDCFSGSVDQMCDEIVLKIKGKYNV